MQQLSELLVRTRLREREQFWETQRHSAAFSRRWDAERKALAWERLASWASDRAAAARMW